MKRLLQLSSALVLVVLLFVVAKTHSLHFFKEIKNYTQHIPSKDIVQESIGTIAEAIKKEISNPVPLIWDRSSAQAHLTHDGVVTWTNTQRAQVAELPALTTNNTLDQIAQARLADMFEQQYFEHISPQGEGATELAARMDYDYISLGENIALGNFEDDEVLVQAWMDSPGHRANILNTKFIEIGVAVGQGTYEGRKTWIGVQVFGKPNTCTPVDQSRKDTIVTLTEALNKGKIKIDALTEEIEKMKNDPHTDRTAYNQKVEDYNALARELNTLSADVKKQVTAYNTQVRIFNLCIKS